MFGVILFTVAIVCGFIVFEVPRQMREHWEYNLKDDWTWRKSVMLTICIICIGIGVWFFRG